MSTIDQIQAGLKTRMGTISGLDAHATEPEKSSGTNPLGYPRLVPTLNEFDDDLSDGCRYAFDLWVLVPIGDRGLNRAQTTLNPFLSPTGANSLKVAVEGDVTLGGVAQSSRVTGISNYGPTAMQGTQTQYLAGSVRVEVFAA